MKIRKRDGRLEQLSFDKIIYRLRKLCNDPSLGKLSSIDPDIVAQRVVSSIYDGVSSVELDEEAARIAIGMTDNVEYAKLSSRIIISNLHKSTHECFSEVMEQLYSNVDKNGDPTPILADDVIEVIRQNKNVLNFAIDYSRDYFFDYFGFKTLEKSYLMKIRDNESEKMVVVERPQHLYMRVAVGIHKNDIENAIKTYHLISQHFYTHASPTLFNSGTRLANMASCFTEDTIVATVNKGPVKIKDVEIGDQVITHKGNIKRVVQVHKNMLGERKLYEINVAKTAPIKVTGNHKLWTIRKREEGPQWIAVEDLLDCDYIGTSFEAKDEDCSKNVLTHSGLEFYKFESKREITENLPEYVYTLGVEDDHSYNVGGIIAQNCFLIGTDDSIGGIYKTITDCAFISKVGGGIGVHISNIRAKGSLIRGTNGESDGIIPMLKVYNETCRFVNQSGRRKGSFAIYLEPWHADILEFLDLKKNQGHEDMRARDLFYAIWMPDLFMKTVETDGDWYLMCPDECPGLTDCYGADFEKLYNRYVVEKRYKRVVKAQEIWRKIMDSQIETGVPYIGYKDAVNKKCNQKNLGTIKSSNLCAEVCIFSDDKSYAVCNLSSIALPKYVKQTPEGPVFDFNHLKEVAEHVVLALNCVIDNTYYPTPETRETNLAHRPLGIGVQGLADVYMMMKMPFESDAAKKLNKEIFEALYYGVLVGSLNEAKKHGKYQSYEGSPFSKGLLQFDLAAEHDNIQLADYISGRWDWDGLKEEMKKYGLRNSMTTALMPTASTAQIMGNSECFEPIDSCIFKRRVLSGEYLVINKHLVADLEKLGLWSKEMKDTIIAHNGSIADIPGIPNDLKDIYKNVWEISMKSVIEQARDRGVFVDQMQSMNLFMANPNYKKLTSMHFYAWKNGLKTGMYYLRSKASSSAGKFSVDPELEKKLRDKVAAGDALAKEEEKLLCSIDNKDECMMCSS